MKKTGKVIAVEGNYARLSVDASSSECGTCSSKAFCHVTEGSGKTLTVINQAGAQVGEIVAFDVNAGKVVLAAFLVWIVPIMAMIVGYLVGNYLNESYAVIMAFGFLIISYLLLRFINKAATGGTSFYPFITEIIDPETDTQVSCQK